MKKYNFKKIEAKWQKQWEKKKVFAARDDFGNKKFYPLIEFPYPSGEGLHVGHPRSYTALDILSRKKRMQGYNVLYPIGFDAFGLPAENYAIKTGTHPKLTIQKNIKNFTRQLKALGLSFDWSRSVTTTDPKYYKWTQWIFLELFKHGLAYKAKIPINWCPKDKIGLANEEVVNGKCERCGTAVERREKDQWLIRITRYADRLLQDLEPLDYLEPIKAQQRNWIGKSEGAEIEFVIAAQNTRSKMQDTRLKVFTTRPDTIFGATFMVIAPEHKLIQNQESRIKNFDEVKEYIEKAKRKSDMERTELNKEKTGVRIEGIEAINPATGKPIPIFVADYVLISYGTGAIMAVPAHDERDYEFAKKYTLPIIEVIAGGDIATEAFTDTATGTLVQSGKFSGLKVPDAKARIIEWLSRQKLGRGTTQYKLRDWVFSRQRYWGEPIPLVYCEHCKKRKQKVLIIHGFEGSGEGNWLPWMKRELEARGLEVMTPTMSTSFHPNVEQWIKELMPLVKGMNEDDIVIGHSLGSKAALHLIERTRHSIGALYLVASAIGEVGERDWERLSKLWPESDMANLRKFWEAPVNFDLIDALVKHKHLILSEDDPFVGKKTHDIVPAHWMYELWRGFGHFQGPEAPELRDLFLHSQFTGWIPLPESELPLTLPSVKMYEPTDSGESPLAKITAWTHVSCPRCGEKARRETDTMPNWAGSNWYFLRYCDPKNAKTFADAKKLSYWMPVDWYNGGMEHTTLHLLYSRFIYKFLWDVGHVPAACGPEPYRKRTSHGMILGAGGEKMSKSKGNVINPDTVVAEFGADVFRLYEMFIGPFDQAAPWDTKGILGIKRFLDRVWQHFQSTQVGSAQTTPEAQTLLHQTIKKVTADIDHLRLNTAVSQLMILLNTITDQKISDTEYLATYIRLLSPFAPHLCEEIWTTQLKNKKLVVQAAWPEFDDKKIQGGSVEIAVQVNGKLRDSILFDSSATEAAVLEGALSSAKVTRHVSRENIIKTIYVPKRLLNIVVKK